MTAFRHWRLAYIDIEHGGRRGEAAEIEMRLTAGGSDETGSGTPSVRSTFSGSAANAFDNDTGTKWVSADFDWTWVAYDFGVGNDKAIVEVSLRVNLSQTGPTHLRVEASTDGTTWIPQFYAFDLTWGTSDTQVFTFGPLPPPLRITTLKPTTITVTGDYVHPAAAQESVQWQLDGETDDFSTPLQDTGEISTDLTSHVFSSLVAQTVYQVRCRMKEEDNSTWSPWVVLPLRTPEFINASWVGWAGETLGSSPSGWTGPGDNDHFIEDDFSTGEFAGDGRLQNRDFSSDRVLLGGNAGAWSPEVARLVWTSGPSIANQRVVALARIDDANGAVVVGARWDGVGDQGYFVHFHRDIGDNDAFLRGPGGLIDSDAAAGFSISTWHWVIIEVNGSSVQAKWWALGTAEPGSFQLSGTDAGFTDAGDMWMDADRIGGTSLPLHNFMQLEHLEAQIPDKAVLTVGTVSENAVSLSTNAFAGGSGVHMDTQWQVATDAGFAAIVHDVLSDTDLEAHNATGLQDGTAHWARARWRDDEGQFGLYSDGKMFTTTTNPGCGDKPSVSVGSITDVAVTLSTVPVDEYIETHFRILLGGLVVQQIQKLGSSRFQHTFTGLAISTAYTAEIRVRRTCGFSSWSVGEDFTTLAVAPASVLGCPTTPQGYLWNPDANPDSFEHWRGTGWFTPYAGEPLAGVVVCKLRVNESDKIWDIDISDDLGVTYTPLVVGLSTNINDGDGLQEYSFSLDTTLLADGIDYRLRATDDTGDPTVVIESLSFAVDNVGQMSAWSKREFDIPEDKFGTMWCTKKIGGVWGDPAAEAPYGDKIWWQGGTTRDIIALRGHPWSSRADHDLKKSIGGDVTLRFYLWSGEGGFAGVQGAIDIEGWSAGISFFTNGISETADTASGVAPEQTGIFVGLTYLAKGHAFGCCDDYYTMQGGVSLDALGRAQTNLSWAGLVREDDDAKNSAGMQIFSKMYGPSWFNKPRWEDADLFAGNNVQYREGHLPGIDPRVASGTCGRRYSMYTIRARVEVDPLDSNRIRIRTRADGPGLDAPSSGYWHYDKWHNLRATQGETAYLPGCLGMASKQFASTLWGDANGARNFVSWSALPILEGTEECGPTDPLEPFNPPFEGRPCSLILEAYEEDRETVKWEVGTDRGHFNPYLDEPENYGEQEIDIIAGAATIAQVEVIIVDKNQTVADQDSGWVTQRLSELGVGAVHGRRFRLRRFISFELGWVTIADGPGGSPRLDDTYAAYRLSIRDTRETERKIRAFTEAGFGTTTLLPMGVEMGFGQSIDPETGDEHWVIAATEPILGSFFYRNSSTPGKPRAGYVDFGTHWSGTYNPFFGLQPESQKVKTFLALPESVYEAGAAEVITTGGSRPVFFTWPDIEILWRPAGTEDEYIVIKPSDTIWTGQQIAKPAAGSSGASLWGKNLFRAFTGQTTELEEDVERAVRWVDIQGVDELGNLKTDFVYPAEGQVIEVIVRWIGKPTEFAPTHIEFNDLQSYLWLPAGTELNNFARSEHDSLLNLSGNMSFRAEIAPNTWDETGVVYNSPGNWYLALRVGGFIEVGITGSEIFDDGVERRTVSNASVEYSAAAKAWIRADLDPLVAIVTFYSSGDGLVWFQVGDPIPVPGANIPWTVNISFTGLDIGNTQVTIPLIPIPPMRGRVYRVQIWSEIAAIPGTIRIVYDAEFDAFLVPVLSFNESGPNGILVTIMQDGLTPAEMRITGTQYTIGEFLRDLYDGVYSTRDAITGDLIPSGIRYDPSAVLRMVDPVRMRLTEPIEDVREWSEKHLYAPSGWVPALDFDLRISPKSQVPPPDFSVLPIITNAVTEAVPSWNAGEQIVNVLSFKYQRVMQYESFADAVSADKLRIREIEIEFRDEASITRHGEQTASYDTEAFVANGGATGEPFIDLTLEQGWLHAQERRLYVFDRYVNGAQAVRIPVRRSFSATFQPGEWVIVDISWIPDYLLKRRGGVFGGQLLAIEDVDCAWRVLLIEEALPVAIS